MTAKKSTKLKSRTSTKSKKGGFKFKWWMGLIVVVVVGGVGFFVYRSSFAYRECRNTPTGAICGGGPVYFRISNLQYNPNAAPGISKLSMTGHFPNNFNPRVYATLYTMDQDDAIYRLGGQNQNNDCGRISQNSPFSYKSGNNVNFYSPNELRYGISYAWWTPVGCP